MSRKIVIDYEAFKEVLSDFLADRLVEEFIDNLNDNDVFIEDVEE